jgi:hypothetical protein
MIGQMVNSLVPEDVTAPPIDHVSDCFRQGIKISYATDVFINMDLEKRPLGLVNNANYNGY